jgi:hypothetical protein
LDEFSLGILKEITAGKNKWLSAGCQILQCIPFDNLLLQLEYNHVRPYVYSHSVPIMDIIIKVSDINGAVISKNLLLLLDTIKAGILLMQNYCRYSRLGF